MLTRESDVREITRFGRAASVLESMSTDLPDTRLLDEVRACTLCALSLPFEPRPVLQFHPDARILIAGQAPGRRAHVSGVPFDDPSGVRLRAWLGVSDEIFYDPTLFAILPMGMCFPGTGVSGDLPPRPECAPTWRPRLLAELTNVRLTLVIGQYALAYHLPSSTIGTVTQRVEEWRTYWPSVVPLPHPSPRNYGWLSKNPWFAQELLPALRTRVADVLAE